MPDGRLRCVPGGGGNAAGGGRRMGGVCAVLIPAHGGKLQRKQVLTTELTIAITSVDAGTSNSNRKCTVPVTACPVLDMRGGDRRRIAGCRGCREAANKNRSGGRLCAKYFAHKFSAIVHVERIVDPATMFLCSVLADAKPLSDLFVGVPGCHQHADLGLSTGQQQALDIAS